MKKILALLLLLSNSGILGCEDRLQYKLKLILRGDYKAYKAYCPSDRDELFHLSNNKKVFLSNKKRLALATAQKINPKVKRMILQPDGRYRFSVSDGGKKPKRRKKTKVSKNREVKKIRELEKGFFLDMAYGLRYYSVEQNGDIENAKMNGTSLNYTALKVGVIKDDVTYQVGFGINTLKVASNTDNEEKFVHYLFKVIYKGFSLGYELNKNPLLKNNDGSLEIFNLGVSNIEAGYENTIELNMKKESRVKWGLYAGIPIHGSLAGSKVKKGISGYNIDLEAAFERIFYQKSKRQAFYFLKQELQYRRFKTKTVWEESSGFLSYTNLNTSFQAGIRVEL